jgi:hypothetical protein
MRDTQLRSRSSQSILRIRKRLSMDEGGDPPWLFDDNHDVGESDYVARVPRGIDNAHQLRVALHAELEFPPRSGFIGMRCRTAWKT